MLGRTHGIWPAAYVCHYSSQPACSLNSETSHTNATLVHVAECSVLQHVRITGVNAGPV